MITITDPRIESYLMNLLPNHDPIVAAMEQRARETGVPIVGPLVGRLLYLLTRLKRPNLIVELGSGFGYSAYWFARALGDRGKVVLTDYSADHIDYARRAFEKCGLAGAARFHTGNALEIGRNYDNIDILFIDIDKYQYPAAIRTMLPSLGENALVIADNALWHGTVAEDHPDYENSGAIREFNDFMFNSGDFCTSILPLRDGVLLGYKVR
jgi:predicted O-methyltransferase YrrM